MSNPTEIINPHLIDLSVFYAKEYKRNGANFITCFLKYRSVRTACAFIVRAYDKIGFVSDADFSDYANKQPVDDRWKPVLNKTLKIIYEITK